MARLNMEEVKVFKEGKKHPGKYIYDLFDTIEAQQQEIEQLNTIINKPKCEDANKYSDGKCQGLCKSEFDDEPLYMCQKCKDFEHYEE